MKRIICLLLAIMIASIVFGQTEQKKISKKIAVYVTGSTVDGINDVVTDRLLIAITKDKKYTVVERASDFLAGIRKEQNFQRSGDVDNNQISELGKQFGVEVVCICKITPVLGTNNIATRLVDVESAAIIASFSKADKFENYDNLVATIDDIAKNLLNDLAQRNRPVVGQTYQGGILVFINETGEHGMVITKQDLDSGKEMDWNDAYSKCNGLVIDGYDDWYLPTKEELYKCFAVGDAIGLVSTYWSSTKCYEGTYPYYTYGKIGTSCEYYLSKYRVRAVRSF